jgi:hypothetical protein
MHTKVCERCDMEMRLIPAGVSKRTGKPYSAFWSCDKRNGGCGETARAEGEAAQAAPMAGGSVPVASDPSQLDRIEQKLDEIISFLRQG